MVIRILTEGKLCQGHTELFVVCNISITAVLLKSNSKTNLLQSHNHDGNTYDQGSLPTSEHFVFTIFSCMVTFGELTP
jgi:hypothetical protein